jgi:polar amino acid transport system substrate-binding protein
VKRFPLQWLYALGLIVGLLSCSIQVVAANNTAQPSITVATRILPPMVVENGGKLSGFSIDLWDEIAARLGVQFEYKVNPDVRALLQSLRNNEAQVGIAAISITSARTEEFDFSQPMLSAGLQILVRHQGDGSGQSPLRDLLGLLFSWTSLTWLGIAVLMVIIPAHLVWWVERKDPEGIVTSTRYFPGIFQALYWAFATLATQADSAPRHWVARIITVVWMFMALVFVALYTAQLAATLTVAQIGGGINGPEDLVGRRVGVTKGSTAAAAVEKLGARAVEVAKIDEAFDALERKDVDAVVFDSPVLMYYAANEGKGKASVLGAPFVKEDYGIAFPRNETKVLKRPDTLRNKVDTTLLKMREDGSYQRIHDKWFGKK